jgi:photosystem II stability/assembly factor-like uncharacterized protein
MFKPIGSFLLALPLIAQVHPAWQLFESGSTASFRGISQAAGSVWVSGTKGTVLRNTGTGAWQPCSIPPGAEKLDFRGIWAFDGNRALVLSIGPGEQSRVYRTSNGCANWQQVLINTDPKGFWDIIAFSDEKHGLILGDPVDGHFTVLRTNDGGDHWAADSDPGLAALPSEGAFAASNSSLVINPETKVEYIGTSGPRVFLRLPAEGAMWSSVRVPLSGVSPGSGVFSLAFRDGQHGVAVVGNYEKPAETAGTAAFTSDGGKTWTAPTSLPGGYRSAVGYEAGRKIWVAVGTNGSDYSVDDGKTWTRIENAHNWNAVSLPWTVGPKGKIGKLTIEGETASSHQ